MGDRRTSWRRKQAGFGENYIELQNEKAGHFQEGEVQNLRTLRIVGKPESAGINRHVVGDARARAAMLADVPVGESPIGGSAQLPP
jgi:hypothetical protein